jgi:hypothetical protein
VPPCRASGRNQAPRGTYPGGATSMRARRRRNEYCAKPVLVRPGEANSCLAPRACLRPVAGGSLRPPPVLDADGRMPAAPARGSIVTTRVPAVPGRGINRRSRALEQSVTCRRGACRQRLSGTRRKRALASQMPKRGKTGLVSTVSAPFLRPLFRIGKLRLPAWAVTGSSMQDERPLGRCGKPETSRNGHTVPDRRVLLKRRLTMAAYWSN